jgi:hypothetical protein
VVDSPGCWLHCAHSRASRTQLGGGGAAVCGSAEVADSARLRRVPRQGERLRALRRVPGPHLEAGRLSAPVVGALLAARWLRRLQRAPLHHPPLHINSMPLHYPLRLVALTPKRIPRSKSARGRGVGGRAGSWVVARCCAMRVRLPSLGLRVQVVRGSVAHAVARGSVAHAVPGPGGGAVGRDRERERESCSRWRCSGGSRSRSSGRSRRTRASRVRTAHSRL